MLPMNVSTTASAVRFIPVFPLNWLNKCVGHPVSHWHGVGLHLWEKGRSENVEFVTSGAFPGKYPPFFFFCMHKIKVWRYRNKNSPVPRAARYFRVIYCLFQAKTKSALPCGITGRQETSNTNLRAGFWSWSRILTHLIDSPNAGS